MHKNVQPVFMKVTFHVQKSFDREHGFHLKLVGRCQPDFAQTAKSRFIREMQSPVAPIGSCN
ncbi:MAG: hypothetical protein KDB27_27785 [Planctomycetales bacterium]|nr:hypothetical protein [Planctomycetales bacterium]